MNPVEIYAALRWVVGGLPAAVEMAADAVMRIRELTGAKSFDTRFGRVTVVKKAPTIAYDDTRLLAWAQANMPHEVEPEHTVIIPARVRPTLHKTLAQRFRVEGDLVVDSQTGEVIDFATVTPGTEYLSMRMPAETREAAVEHLLPRVEQIAHTMTGLELEAS